MSFLLGTGQRPGLYPVKRGNYLGQNFGVVTAIDETQISLRELIEDGGAWAERAPLASFTGAGVRLRR